MKHLLLFVFLGIFSSINAQQHPLLDNFFIIESNGSVYLNWTIKGGKSCNGIRIYRSEDSTNFHQIGSIEGICGNIDFPQPYSFIDENPVENKINYYKIELGLEGFSSVLSLEIIGMGKSGSQVRPNPAKDHARVYFNNPKKNSSSLLLYNASGNVVQTQNSELDYFDLNFSGVDQGTYVYIILQKDKLITTGRIITNK